MKKAGRSSGSSSRPRRRKPKRSTSGKVGKRSFSNGKKMSSKQAKFFGRKSGKR
jgi:hypothetical protein